MVKLCFVVPIKGKLKLNSCPLTSVKLIKRSDFLLNESHPFLTTGSN